MDAAQKRRARVRRHARVRKPVSGTAGTPRRAVYRSHRLGYSQLIVVDGEVKAEGDKTARAKAVGELLAQRAKDAGVERAVFDRGGRLYHGRVAALADGAREGGLAI